MECSEKVGVEQTRGVGWLNILDGADDADAGVVDQDIDPTESFDRSCHQIIHHVALGDVAWDSEDAVGGERFEGLFGLTEARGVASGDGQFGC